MGQKRFNSVKMIMFGAMFLLWGKANKFNLYKNTRYIIKIREAS